MNKLILLIPLIILCLASLSCGSRLNDLNEIFVNHLDEVDWTCSDIKCEKNITVTEDLTTLEGIEGSKSTIIDFEYSIETKKMKVVYTIEEDGLQISNQSQYSSYYRLIADFYLTSGHVDASTTGNITLDNYFLQGSSNASSNVFDGGYTCTDSGSGLKYCNRINLEIETFWGNIQEIINEAGISVYDFRED